MKEELIPLTKEELKTKLSKDVFSKRSWINHFNGMLSDTTNGNISFDCYCLPLDDKNHPHYERNLEIIRFLNGVQKIELEAALDEFKALGYEIYINKVGFSTSNTFTPSISIKSNLW